MLQLVPDSIDILSNIIYLDLFNNYNDLAMLNLLSTANDLRQKYLFEQCYLINCLNRYFPDSIRIVANRRRTRPPMEGISLCGHSAAPIW